MKSYSDISYETYLRYVREAEQRGVQHSIIISRKGWENAVRDARKIDPGKARNVSRYLEGESRVNRVSSVSALQKVLKTAQRDIRAEIQQGETITPLGQMILTQKRTIKALNQADIKLFWKTLHEMYSRNQIYTILGSPEEEHSN